MNHVSTSRLRQVAVVGLLSLAASSSIAAALSPSAAQEVRRGLGAVGDQTSEAPALRREDATHQASPEFALGATLGAWRNAYAKIGFDLAHPAGDGGDAGLLRTDCSDEEVAFSHLQAQAAALRLTPQAAVEAAGLDADAATWTARTKAGPGAC